MLKTALADVSIVTCVGFLITNAASKLPPSSRALQRGRCRAFDCVRRLGDRWVGIGNIVFTEAGLPVSSCQPGSDLMCGKESSKKGLTFLHRHRLMFDRSLSRVP